MSTIEKHTPGSFCWIELGTTDQAAAKKFYGSLLGWDVREFPMGPNETYTIFQVAGRDAAAGYTMRPEERAQGIPPNWLPYIAVESADAKAEQAKSAGGSLLHEPFDVGEMGRMAVITDPTGAVFAIWQAKASKGIGVADENGALCWADLNTPDPQRASKFYSELFGWKFELSEKDSSGYLHIKNGETYIGGIPPCRPESDKIPAHWMAYFQVANCDASVAQATQQGARSFMPPMTLEGVGKFGILADPQGAVFAIFQPIHG